MALSQIDMREECDMSQDQKKSVGLNTALDMRAALASGSISARALIETVLGNIEALNDKIQAFSYVDKAGALEQADMLDAYRTTGKPLGPLHGVPVVFKDIIDVRGMPCERGSELFKGRVPAADAQIVSLLREAGAVILGKTVTTEMAYFAPGKTRNPHNTDHTPGGSSSGSAASVAAGMVPLSIGSQTNGSMIRPASFCGIYGYKPSFGRVSRTGVLRTSGHLDTLGVFARSLDDLALLADVLLAYDARDEYMAPLPRPAITKLMNQDLVGAPRLAFMRTPYWDKAEESTKDAFRELIEVTDGAVDIVDMPPIFTKVHDALGKLMSSDFAAELGDLYRDHKDKMSPQLIEIIERGQGVSKEDLKQVFELQEACGDLLDTYFDDYDAILAPSACGEAPKGLTSTGDPGFSTIWQFVGKPCLNLPLFDGPNGLPIGAQLIGQRDWDGRLFSVARHFLNELEEGE